MLWERKHSPGRGEGPRVAPGNGNRVDLNLPSEPSSIPAHESQLSPTIDDGPAIQAPAATTAIVETAPLPGSPGQTIIARSALIRGELWVHEDLVIDGQFEGTLPVDG